MIPLPHLTSVDEVLAHLAHSGPEWVSRLVRLNFNGNPEAWFTLYPIQGNSSPYFDFAYRDAASPQVRLADVLARFDECEIIDWSPGRLACIQVNRADVAQLARIITAVAEAVFGMDRFDVEMLYEDMQRA